MDASFLNRSPHQFPAPSRKESIPLTRSPRDLTTSLYRFLFFDANPFWIQLCYFVAASFVGFLVLKALPMRDAVERPKDLDMFFMSVSANAVSSMSTVEMEVFSDSQLVVLTLLMLIGGEVFTSMLGLQFQKIKSKKKEDQNIGVSLELSSRFADQIELGSVEKSAIRPDMSLGPRYDSLRYLGFVVLGYLLVTHVGGYTLILVYVSCFPSVRAVLEAKEIRPQTFSFFTTVSSFTNCGFVPTNENMMVFRDCSGLLLMIMVLILCGNTMYPPCLRSAIWVLKKLTKRKEFDRILRDQGVLGYDHFLPRRRSVLLALTVAGFVMVQFVLLCSMEWRSESLEGMSPYQKTVGALFMSVNSRHAGESIVDLSTFSSAILVLYVVMMYLPPYTSFLPIQDDGGLPGGDRGEDGKKRGSLARNLIFSQLSYLAFFIIIICITERRQLSEDPLNFNVLNIVFEVISAYGNVGYSVGYRCKRQLKPDAHCNDAWYGFSGRWSSKGKLALIAVMFFGRLKKFNMAGGQAWILS